MTIIWVDFRVLKKPNINHTLTNEFMIDPALKKKKKNIRGVGPEK